MNKLICTVEGCKNIQKSLSFCNLHYRRFKVHNDPLKVLVDHNLPSGEAPFNWLFYIYKKNAEKRNLSFNLNKTEFRNFTKNPCYFCKKLPSTIMKSRSSKGDYIYNGIDRINSNLGYFLENCVSCCTICNMMKRDMNVEDFLIHIQMIHENDLEENLLINLTYKNSK